MVSTGYDRQRRGAPSSQTLPFPWRAFGSSISRLPGLGVTRSKPAFVEMSGFASNKTLCHPTRFIILFISKAAVPLALFPERPVSRLGRRMLTRSWGSSPGWDSAG